MTQPRNPEASRRLLLGGIVGIGLGTPLLAACGSDDASVDDNGGGDGSTTSSGPIGKTSEVPVGGAKIYPDEKTMVSQPTEGDFKAFSTICTHRQCPITELDGQEIECSCHGSRFFVKDGTVAKGPATEPLTELSISVEGDEIVIG